MGNIPEGQGYFNVRVVANPGAGAQFAINPVMGVRMRVVGFRFRLTTDATVISRQAHVQIRNAATICSVAGNSHLQPASSILEYNFWPGYTGAPLSAGVQILMPWTPLYVMDDAFFLRSDVENIQAGDTITLIAYATEEWISGP